MPGRMVCYPNHLALTLPVTTLPLGLGLGLGLARVEVSQRDLVGHHLAGAHGLLVVVHESDHLVRVRVRVRVGVGVVVRGRVRVRVRLIKG